MDHDRRVVAQPGVRIHRTMHFGDRAQLNTSPPRIRYEEAVLDVAQATEDRWQRIELVSRVCRGRWTTARRLHERVAERGRLHDRAWLLALLDDIAEGACSVLEHAYLTQVERAHGLPRAVRQRAVDATIGLTYRDAESHGTVLELDGRLFHDTTAQRDKDMDRDLDAQVAGVRTVRLSYGQVFDRGCQTAVRVAALLRRGGWAGSPQPCGPGCPVLASGDAMPGGSTLSGG